MKLEDLFQELLTAIHASQAHFTSQLEAVVARSNQGVMLRGAEVKQVGGNAGQQISSTASGRLVGCSFRETAGAAAVIVLRDGVDNSGPEIMSINLAANESIRDWYGPGGISFGRGLYADIVSGAILGAVYIGAVD